MKRITVLTMLCCTLFCVCAIASGIGRERKLLFITSLSVADHTPPASTSVAVSGEVITHLDMPTVTADHDSNGQEKSVQMNKVQTVTDLTGKKQKLKLGNVNINNKEIFIPKDSSAEYAQVADGHYYYLRREGERRYTLYCDKGDKVGRFWIDKWYYYESCFKYGDRFYVILYHFDEYPRITIDDEYCILTVVDFTKGELRKLRRIENLEDYDACLYKDKIKEASSVCVKDI